ncbi:MAG: acetyl-CoA hydrolase/transferase C-terminal domain-containing protein [Burkholderiaceae bacterium]|nr:acetyl-CoA hydrolase/transferase C-terminal domain-containing protein [Burkholderiaceae bacterium]
MQNVSESTLPDLTPYVREGDRIHWGQANAEPLTLTRALVAQRHRIGRTHLFMGIGLGRTFGPEHADAFTFASYCGTGGNRKLAAAGLLDIVATPYSQLPAVMGRGGALQIDVVLLQVSPPDAQGRFSLGLAQDLLPSAIRSARVLIGEINPDVPWTHGGMALRAEDFALMVPSQFAPLQTPGGDISPVETQIARRVADLIGDGATLQIGLGSVPEAILSALRDRRDLGLHSGVVGDEMVALAECGALTNARKGIDPGVGVVGVLTGSQILYRHAHCNPALELRGNDYIHDPTVLGSIERLTAINSAIEVDVTGQVNAEVAGGVYVGAVGGAPDFLRAAARSKGGLPIVALPSMAGSHSRIVARLSGPASAARCDAGIFVTEHGVADLRGLPLTERVRRMVELAEPSRREDLLRSAWESLPGVRRPG